ncbi:MAG: hypothetical protein Q4A10_05340 [Aerococcaceae bacterium]|nr:hypothetical protein [Aerococcaceae bacterium]
MKRILQMVLLIVFIVLAIGATLQGSEYKGLLIGLAAFYSTYLLYTQKISHH